MSDLDKMEQLLDGMTPTPWREDGYRAYAQKGGQEITLFETKHSEATYEDLAVLVLLRNNAEELLHAARRLPDLLSAARRDVLALAHASEQNSQYTADYHALSAAIEKASASPIEDAAFDAWYSMQAHQLGNAPVCRVIWRAAWKAAKAEGSV